MSVIPLASVDSTTKESSDPMPHPHLTYLIVIRWSTRERAFIAKAPGLSGCTGTGATYQAALNSCLEAMRWRAEHAEQHGQSLPPAELSWSDHTASEETERSALGLPSNGGRERAFGPGVR